jgi:hypothetical protein
MILIVLLIYIFNRSTKQETSSVVINNCDSKLWEHVYHKYRLEVIEECKSVTGTIEKIRKEDDGDLHMLLKLDAGQENLLNDKNISGQHGDLVLEPICVNKVTQEDAKEPCSGYVNDVKIPKVGDHVKVTGSYVLDKEHGWNEIHPVTAIESVN